MFKEFAMKLLNVILFFSDSVEFAHEEIFLAVNAFEMSNR